MDKKEEDKKLTQQLFSELTFLGVVFFIFKEAFGAMVGFITLTWLRTMWRKWKIKNEVDKSD